MQGVRNSCTLLGPAPGRGGETFDASVGGGRGEPPASEDQKSAETSNAGMGKQIHGKKRKNHERGFCSHSHGQAYFPSKKRKACKSKKVKGEAERTHNGGKRK